MRPEAGKACVIKSLGESEQVESVELLGAGPLEWNQSFGALAVKLPEKLPADFANCLEITLCK
jgi:alpha-L-fucosidase